MVNIELSTDELITLTALVDNGRCFGYDPNGPFRRLLEKVMRQFDNVKDDLTKKEREYVDDAYRGEFK